MSEHVLPSNPPLEITLRRSGRARRISLRVSSLDGRVTLTVPNHIPDHEGLAFAHQKAGWLRSQLDRQPETQIVGLGTQLPLEGQLLRIASGAGRRIETDDATLFVPGSVGTIPARLQGWLKTRARDSLVAASDKYSSALGRSYSRITLRDTRSRWGSCSHQGGLMYSWRLVLAPKNVLDYLAAHEVAHLAEMNHSPQFCATVERLCPEYENPRQWLRKNGTGLHRFRLTD